MIVERIEFPVKKGCMEEAVAILKAERARTGREDSMRIYRDKIAPFDTLVQEIEYESLAAIDESWDAYFADPVTAEVMAKWGKLIERGSVPTIWALIE